MGINGDQERSAILEAASLLNNGVEKILASNPSSQKVDDWLKSINLEQYSETFRKHLYLDMERVKRVWEVELAAVLEIQKPAHRKRILASVSGCGSKTLNNMRNGSGPNIDDLNKDLNILVSLGAPHLTFEPVISFSCFFFWDNIGNILSLPANLMRMCSVKSIIQNRNYSNIFFRLQFMFLLIYHFLSFRKHC